MMKIASIPTILTIAALSASSAVASPKIGDTAPAVKVAKWFTATPPSLPGKDGAEKHVFLVEFWATWCPPCRKSIPHLAELHAKHGKEGLVIIGISNEEPEEIEAFMKKKDVKMPYFVGMDDDMATNEKWMDDVDGIPHAFLVDRENRVVWAGNPLETESMDQAIRDVLAGKFDLEAAKNAALNAAKFDELIRELQTLYAACRAAGDDGDARKAAEEKLFETLERLIALKPREMRPYLIKRQLLREFDRVKDANEFDISLEAAFKDSAASMMSLAQMELDMELPRRNPALMLRTARRAAELLEWRDAEALSVLAQIECELGFIDDAVKHQTSALGMASPEAEPFHKGILEYYKAVKALHDIEGKSAKAVD